MSSFLDKLTAHAYRNPIYFILAVACIVRLVIPMAICFRGDDFSDLFETYSYEYIHLGQDILKGSFSREGIPELFRTPGYPVFLLPGVITDNLVVYSLVINLLLSCLTVYFIFRIAQIAFDSTLVSTASGLFYALDPLSIIFVALIMPETLFAFLITLGLYFLAQYVVGKSFFHLIAAAMTVTAAAYVNPWAYWLPFLQALVLLSIKNDRPLRKILDISLFLVVSFGLLGIWQLRNGSLTGYSGFSTTYDQGIYFSGLAATDKAESKKSFEDWREDLAEDIAQEKSSDEVSEFMRELRSEGLRDLGEAWDDYIPIHIKGMLRTLTGLAVHGYIRVLDLLPESEKVRDEMLYSKGFLSSLAASPSSFSPWVIVISVLVIGATGINYICAVMALLARSFWQKAVIHLLVATVLYVWIVTGGPWGYSRYRHSMMPELSIFAGYGLCLLTARIRNNESCGSKKVGVGN
jgi:hypothetical protein